MQAYGKFIRQLGLLALATASFSAFAAQGELDIPYTKKVLDNGLTVIISEDHKAPIAAVNVWYHVGSKNEKEGRTGFAHLFEHLMFNGSENWNDEFFKPFDSVGATAQNGTTNNDRTNYFENIPVNALDMALWMESDRMGHLLGAIDQAKLDEQRGVVQNEKRQGENRPYGLLFQTLLKNSYPAGHPYSWPVIGYMEDLDSASLDDVKQWFRDYYGAANAVVSVVGDVDTQEVLKKVEHYFGDIPAGPPVSRPETWVAKRSDSRRIVMEDRVPQPLVLISWNVPERGSYESDMLQLAADVMGGGKNSRLYKRLVIDEKLATDIDASMVGFEIGGLFELDATLKPDSDPAKVERILREELAEFLRKGPTEDELDRVRSVERADFLRNLERIDGFGGKSDILASSEVYRGSPDGYKEHFARYAKATPSAVRAVAQQWLSSGDLVMEYKAYPDYKVASAGADRSKLPEAGKQPDVNFPAIETAELSNGLKIMLAHRDDVPVVNMSLEIDAGYAADKGAKPGTAKLAMNMLDEGTKDMDALEISEQLALLGAELSAESTLDVSSVVMSALHDKLDPSLELFADVVLEPAFAKADFERLQQAQLAAIQQEKNQPAMMARRVFPQLVYGKGHSYSLPFTGSGFEDSVKSITPADLREFHDRWFKPNNATLVVAGDVTMAQLKPKLEKLFGNWRRSDVPQKSIETVALPEKPVVYIVDRPDAPQSVIVAGHLVPPKGNEREIAFVAANDVLGGGFSARINMNLREDKHWAYGAYSILPDARGQRPLFMYAPVQTDKTKEALAELKREFTEITGKRPATTTELQRVKDESVKTLPGRWETTDSVLRSMAEIVDFNLPLDYWNTYPEQVRSLKLEQVNAVAKDFLKPSKMVWVVVGDRKKIENGIRELKLGEIRFIDADGKPLEQ